MKTENRFTTHWKDGMVDFVCADLWEKTRFVPRDGGFIVSIEMVIANMDRLEKWFTNSEIKRLEKCEQKNREQYEIRNLKRFRVVYTCNLESGYSWTETAHARDLWHLYCIAKDNRLYVLSATEIKNGEN